MKKTFLFLITLLTVCFLSVNTFAATGFIGYVGGNNDFDGKSDTTPKKQFLGLNDNGAMGVIGMSGGTVKLYGEGSEKKVETVVKMTIGKYIAYVNGEGVTLDVAPIIKNSRTLLPVRFIAESLGAAVEWNGATSTATMSTVMESCNPQANGCGTYWYSTKDYTIAHAKIFILSTLDQDYRNAVIIHEIYNILGLPNDSKVREDSIIYQYEIKVKKLSETDELLLKLLYNQKMKSGMGESECDTVIREIYY